ncbi:hypothetical protein [Streptomyces flavovirens]
MDVVVLLLLLAAGSALWAVLRPLVIYPCRLGEWRRYAFGAEYHQEREALRRASRDRAAVQRTSSEDLKAIEKRIAEIDSTRSGRVQALGQQRQTLLNPGRGERVDGEGELELYERNLVFLKKAPEGQELPAEHSMPLTGLTAETDSDAGHLYIVVTRPDERRSATYPLTKGPEVRRLVDAIYTAVQKEEADCGKREREAAGIATEIQRIQDDVTTQVAEAQGERAELIETQRQDQRRAEADFRAQCDAWAKLTGRRPNWWWRW